MEFKRSQRQHFLTFLLFLMVSWLWYDFITAGTVTGVILGLLCGGWAAFVAYGYLRTPSLGRLDPDGLTLHRPLRSVSFTWDQLQWASLDLNRRAIIFAYRHQGDANDRYITCSRKSLAPDALGAIVAAVKAARPDLPSGPPATQKGAKT